MRIVVYQEEVAHESGMLPIQMSVCQVDRKNEQSSYPNHEPLQYCIPRMSDSRTQDAPARCTPETALTGGRYVVLCAAGAHLCTARLVAVTSPRWRECKVVAVAGRGGLVVFG